MKRRHATRRKRDFLPGNLLEIPPSKENLGAREGGEAS